MVKVGVQGFQPDLSCFHRPCYLTGLTVNDISKVIKNGNQWAQNYELNVHKCDYPIMYKLLVLSHFVPTSAKLQFGSVSRITMN